MPATQPMLHPLDQEGDCGCLHYPHPVNGDLIPLAVQNLETHDEYTTGRPWADLGKPAFRIPSIQAAWYWILSPILVEGSEERRFTARSTPLMLMRLLSAAPLTSVVLASWTDGIPSLLSFKQLLFSIPETTKDDLMYDALPVALSHASSAEARLPTSAPFSANIHLGAQETQSATPSSPVDTTVAAPSRSGGVSVRPRYLCFLTGDDDRPYETLSVSDYICSHGDQADTEFIFVSYTRMQFRVASDEEISAYDYPDEATREANRRLAIQDRQTLAEWGVHAARSAGKGAFWLDFECVRDADGVARATSKSEDVYRICDIVRAAHSMIIAIGPSTEERLAHLLSRGGQREGKEKGRGEEGDSSQWLRQWGSRLWTLPELLLCPNEYRIKLYVSGESVLAPKALAKRNFAERAWEDAESVKELVNHYEASAILTPVQLISIALECFARRTTATFSAGDVAYAIMGLFPDSQRPVIDQSDSGFRAFARLAIAVDDGNILARMLCLAPPRPGSPWSDTADRWGEKLGHVRPVCSVFDVAPGSDALVVHDVPATVISWHSIEPSERLRYWGGFLSLILLAMPFWQTFVNIPSYLVTLATMSARRFRDVSFTMPAITVALLLLGCLYLPFYFLRMGTSYDPSKEKSRIIGIQGVADPAMVERYIWGFNHGRLQLVVDDDEQDRSSASPRAESAGQAFTIVDTAALTITVVRCSAPPVALLVCGHSGATDRALLCSFDCRTGSYHRERVLRVATTLSQAMHRARSIHLSLTPLNPSPTSSSGGNTSEHAPEEIPPLSKTSEPAGPWTSNVRFLLIALTGARIFSLGPTSNSPVAQGSFLGGTVLAQLVASWCLYKGLLSRLTAPALYCCQLLYYIDLIHRVLGRGRFEIVLALLTGTANGLAITCVVFWIWSWSSPRQLAWRVPAWSVLSIEAMWASSSDSSQYMLADFVVSMIVLTLASACSAHLKLPQDVSPLELPGKLAIVNSSALGKHHHKPTVAGPRWLRQQQLSWLSSSLLFSALIVALAFVGGDLIPSTSRLSGNATIDVLPAASVVALGVSAKVLSPSRVPALCYLVMFICSFAGVFYPFRLQGLILSCIWIVTVDGTDTLPRAFSSLCLSTVAFGAGLCVSISAPRPAVLGWPLFPLIQTILSVLMGGVAVARRRRGCSVERAAATQAAYGDV